MNENKNTSDWLRKVADENESLAKRQRAKADELDSAQQSIGGSLVGSGDKPKPVGVAPLKPKPDEFAKTIPKAKTRKELYESKQLRGY